MKTHSAGLIIYRLKDGQPKVLMAHMGTPWWAKKDTGAWTIPKGEVEEGEEPLAAAKREFVEELGIQVPDGELIKLGEIEQHNNKVVSAWAIEADPDINDIKSSEVEIEWPPRSGRRQKFPEIDRAAWLSLTEAAQKASAVRPGYLKNWLTSCIRLTAPSKPLSRRLRPACFNRLK